MSRVNLPLVHTADPGRLDLTGERIAEIFEEDDMTTIAVPGAGFDLARVKALDTPALRDELARAIGLAARHLIYLAAVWAELESRGEDLSDLRRGWWAYIPRIAAGAVVPEAVAKFAAQPSLLRAVVTLPPAEQKRLADGEPVPLVVRQGDQYTHRMLPAHALTATQARQVFGDGVIRGEGEQIALLTTPARPPKPGKAPKRGKFRADRERGVILLGRKPLPPADLIEALADLRSPDTAAPDDLDTPVVAKLTGAERDKLNHAAITGKTTQQALIRDALRAAGLI